MQNLAFTLAADGSNDLELTKMNPVTMKIYDVNTSKVESNFLDMCISQWATVEANVVNIYQVMNQTTSIFGRQWLCQHGQTELNQDSSSTEK